MINNIWNSGGIRLVPIQEELVGDMIGLIKCGTKNEKLKKGRLESVLSKNFHYIFTLALLNYYERKPLYPSATTRPIRAY